MRGIFSVLQELEIDPEIRKQQEIETADKVCKTMIFIVTYCIYVRLVSLISCYTVIPSNID